MTLPERPHGEPSLETVLCWAIVLWLGFTFAAAVLPWG